MHDKVKELIKSLDNEQEKAVVGEIKDSLVVANAGSGKCLIKNTIIYTNKGMLQIGYIPNHFEMKNDECNAQVVSYNTNGERFIKETSHWFNMGESKTIKIQTNSGYSVEGTPEHPVIILNNDGNLEFKQLQNIKKGEYVAISLNNDIWSDNDIIDEDMAYFMAFLVSDGYLDRGNEISFSNTEDNIIEWYKNFVLNKFNIVVKSYPRNDKNSMNHYFSELDVKNKLKKLGVKMVLSNEKEIPYSVLQSSKKVVVSFLQGLFDLESNVNKSNIELTSASKELIRQLQIVLLNFGIRSSWSIKKVKGYEQDYYRLSISGLALRKFQKEIGYKLNLTYKQKLEEICLKDTNTNVEVFPNQSERLKRIRKNHFVGHDFWDGHRQAFVGKANIRDYFLNNRNPSTNKLKEILSYTTQDEDTIYLNNISDNLIFEPIDIIEEGKEVVYDFTVPDTHSFVSNGIISHNTRVLTHRVAYYILNGIKKIMLLTFTNKASEEMLERVKKLIGDNQDCEILGGTFHHVANIFLRKYSKVVGFENNFNILTPDDALSLIKKLRASVIAEFSEQFQDDFPSEKIIFSIYSTAFNKNMTIIDYINSCEYGFSEETVEIIKRILFMYKQQRQEMNLMDFDDLLKYFYLLLKQKPQIRERISDEFPYILVDEYQDINWIQNEIIELLNEKYHYLFVVGDVNQSIYRFRGSEPSFIQNFEKNHPGCNVYFVRYNYRSHPEILALAEDSINNNDNMYQTKILPFKDKFRLPSVIETENDYTQIEYICNKIREYKRYGIPYKEMAILIRTNFMTRYLEMTLTRNRIPYKILCGTSFFEREHIKDMLSFFKYLGNPKDTISLTRMIGLFKGLGDAKLKIIFESIDNNDLFTFNGNLKNKNATASFEKILEILTTIKSKNGVFEQIEYLYNEFYKEYLFRKFENAIDREMDIMSLFESAKIYKDLTSFLSEVILDNVATEENADKEDVLIITTVHKAKGLEWDAVFLPYLNEEMFPSYRSVTNADIEEERRLFYVAVTRARKMLDIIHIQRNNNGERKPSMFIKELNKKLYKKDRYKAFEIYDKVKFDFEY